MKQFFAAAILAFACLVFIAPAARAAGCDCQQGLHSYPHVQDKAALLEADLNKAEKQINDAMAQTGKQKSDLDQIERQYASTLARINQAAAGNDGGNSSAQDGLKDLHDAVGDARQEYQRLAGQIRAPEKQGMLENLRSDQDALEEAVQAIDDCNRSCRDNSKHSSTGLPFGIGFGFGMGTGQDRHGETDGSRNDGDVPGGGPRY